ncbi:MAG: alpha/beta hydrolase [Janthinobacterium lividum]
MKTKYQFERDVGQVAGGDIKTNTTRAHVYLHIHHGSDVSPITERQRNAITRKAVQIEAETGTEKQMVYRRLMNVFGCSNVETLPRGMYARVVSYLDGWLRYGSATPPPTASRVRGAARAGSTADLIASRSSATAPSDREGETAVMQASSVGDAPHSKSNATRILLAVGAIGTIVAASSVATKWASHAAELSAHHVAQCEYGGERYSAGSVLMQAGLRQQCAVATGIATWQPIADCVNRTPT